MTEKARGRRHLAGLLGVGAALHVAFLVWAQQNAPDFSAPWLDAAYHDWLARGLAFGDWKLPPGMPDPHVDATPFSRPPLYPALLAGVYRLTGGSFLAPRLVQLALGLWTAALACRLTLRLDVAGRLPRWSGLAAAAGVVASPTLLYFQGELMADAPAALVVVALPLLLLRVREEPTLRRVALLGAVLGVGVHLRPQMLLLVPVVGALIYWPRTGAPAPRRALAAATTVAAVVLAMVLPVTVRNHRASGEWVLLATNGPITLLHGNHDKADGFTMSLPPTQELRGVQEMSPFAYTKTARMVARVRGDTEAPFAVAGRYFTDTATTWMKLNPGAFLALTAKKALLLVGPDEVSNNKQVALEMRENPVLRSLPGRWWLLLTLAAVGMVAVLRRARDDDDARAPAAAVLVLLLTSLVTLLPFLAASRFRAPLVPLVAALAAVGAASLWNARRSRQEGAVLGGVLLAAGLALIPSWSGYTPDDAQWRLDRATTFWRAEDLVRAEAELLAARHEHPTHPEVLVHLGVLRGLERRPAEARALFEAALRSRPDHVQAKAQLGAALLQLGRAEEARDLLAATVAAVPFDVRLRYNYALTLERTGDIASARRELEEVLRQQPDFHFARDTLKRLP